MSSRRRSRRLRHLALAGVMTMFAAVAATAFGFVDIYVNPFDKKGQYRQIKSVGGGNKCDRSFLKRRTVMKIVVEDGPKFCPYKPPVQGESSKPDHRFEAHGRILKKTDSNIRDDAYLSISVRVGGDRQYELRIFPKGKDFKFRRQPNGGGFPVNGSNPAIGRPGELNKLRLVAEGNNIKAFVNGTMIGNVTDANADQIDGKKLFFGVGTEANTNKKTHGNFDRLKVSVPEP